MEKILARAIFEAHFYKIIVFGILNIHQGQPVKGIHPVTATVAGTPGASTARRLSSIRIGSTICTAHIL
jgi:hypothetical protein